MKEIAELQVNIAKLETLVTAGFSDLKETLKKHEEHTDKKLDDHESRLRYIEETCASKTDLKEIQSRVIKIMLWIAFTSAAGGSASKAMGLW